MILTQKEFDLLEQVAKHVRTDDKPFKVVSNNNGNVATLLNLGLVETRPKQGNALMQELAITTLGTQVVNNEVEHEIKFSNGEQTMTETQALADNATHAAQIQEKAHTSEHEVVFEDGYEIPTDTVTRDRKPRYALNLMKVGQSFAVPFNGDEPIEKARRRLGALISQTRKRMIERGVLDESATYTVRYIAEHAAFRVWRTN